MRRAGVVSVVVVLVLALVAGGVAAVYLARHPVVGDAPSRVAAPVPATGSGSTAVQLSADAAVHPNAPGVLGQLQRYFDAINVGDYAGWTAVVTPERAAADPQERAWQAAYRTTKDGSVRVDRIDDQIDGTLLVRVRFVSTQALSAAPPDQQSERLCWRSTLPMQGTPLRVAPTRSGSSVSEIC